MKRLALVAVALAVLASPVLFGQDPASLLKAAINTEMVDGDPRAAIEQYKKVAASGDRALAAQALLRMAGCYQKLGDAEAQRIYAQIVREFGDQKQEAAEAANRLSARPAQAPVGVDATRIFSARDQRVYGQSVSADGRYIGYAYLGAVVVQDLVTGQERQIASAAPGEVLGDALISPDGKQVAYRGGAAGAPPQIRVVSVDGSKPRALSSSMADGQLFPCAWTADSNHLLGVGRGGRGTSIAIMSVADGSTKAGASPGGRGSNCGSLSPDGRYVALRQMPVPPVGGSGGPSAAGLFLAQTNGGPAVPLVEQDDANNPVWSADGTRVLFTRKRQSGLGELWSIRVVNGRPQGDPELVDRQRFVRVGGWSVSAFPQLLGVTPRGDYYYSNPVNSEDLYTVDLDPATGTASRPRQVTTRGDNRGAAWSPDGTQLAYFSARAQENDSLVIRTMATGAERVIAVATLEFTPSVVTAPVWSDRGLFVIGRPNDGPSWGIYRVNPLSGQSSRLLTLSPQQINLNHGRIKLALAPDGHTIFYPALTGRGRFDRDAFQIVRQDLAGGPAAVVHSGTGGFSGPSLSNDGATLAFAVAAGHTSVVGGTTGGEWIVMTVPVTGGNLKEICRVKDEISEPIWSRDGRFLYFAAHNNPPRRSPDQKPDIFMVPASGGTPRPMNLTVNWDVSLSLSPDGKRMVFLDRNVRTELWVMRNLFASGK